MSGGGLPAAAFSGEMGLCSDIVPPGGKEAVQLSHVEGCRTGISGVCFGWKVDIGEGRAARELVAHITGPAYTVK